MRRMTSPPYEIQTWPKELSKHPPNKEGYKKKKRQKAHTSITKPDPDEPILGISTTNWAK